MSLPSVFRALVNRLNLAAATLVVLSQAALSGAGNFPSANDGFDPNVNGNVFALAAQPDGKILVGGTFSSMAPNGIPAALRNNIARLNPDGSLDAPFNPNANGTINAIVLQPDGKIVIGGAFSAVGNTARSNVARLNADGSLDTTFNPGASGAVDALALQSNGKIIVGGAFTSVQATARSRLARLNADGSLDTTFNPSANNVVMTVAVQVDGRILVGGGFTTLSPNGGTAVARARVARLNTDGSVDGTFDPEANNIVTKIALQRDGGILVGGNFTTVQPSLVTDPTPRSHLARFNPDGTLDATFDPSPSGGLTAIAVQSDGKVLIGGSFQTLHPNLTNNLLSRGFFARVNFDGTADASFDAGANQVVAAILVQTDGKIVAGGYFSQLLTHSTPAIATIRNHLARVNGDGTLDITFDPNARGGVQAVLVQADGRILIGGSFSSIGGTTRNFLARLNADATLDLSFNPNPNGRIVALAQQSNGQIIIGGSFSTVGGVTRNNIARLNLDGSVDVGAFDPNANGQVSAIAIQSDGKVLIGGFFAALQPNGATDPVARNFFARLNADGGLDLTYNPVPSSQVVSIVIQPDGKALVAGAFTSFQPNNGTDFPSRPFVARINADGSIDAKFSPTANAQVNTLALQGDGKIILAGQFNNLQPNGALTATARDRIARVNADGTLDTAFNPDATTVASVQILTLAIQSDNKILVGGSLTNINGTPRNNFARLNADGTVDTSYDPNPGNQIQVVKVQADGKALIGGAFTALQPAGDIGATPRLHFARLTTAGAVDTTFNPAVGGQAGGQVSALAVQADGRIILAGSLDNIAGATSSNLARFNVDSTPDAGFNPNADGPINAVSVRPVTVSVATQTKGFAWLNSDGSLRPNFVIPSNVSFTTDVTAVARQPDGKILLGSTGNNLLRLNADGSLDSSFDPAPDGGIYSIAVQPNGQIIVTGAFANISGAVRNRVARLNADGTIDTSFDPNANGTVFSSVTQADGKILLAGSFTSLQPNGATTAATVGYLARVNPDGTNDTAFNPNFNAQVNAVTLQADGKILVGGLFTSLTPSTTTTATTRNRIARLNTDGSIDPGFDPNANDSVVAVTVQGNGSILLGGAFTSVGGITRNRIARIGGDGTVDATFDPSSDGQVSAITLMPDSRMLIGGLFTSIHGVARDRIARLNADGSLDTSFNPNASGNIDAIVLVPDGSILLGGALAAVKPNGTVYVGGSFANLGGAAINNFALLTDDGTPSNNFRPNPNGAVFGVTQQADGRVVVAGAFTSIAGTTRNRLARFNADTTLDAAFNPNANGQVNVAALQPDGRTVVGGAFTNVGSAGRNRLARLNVDGSADTFNPGADGQVNAVAIQADGKILVGGAFTNVGGAGRNRLARLNADGTVDTFNPNADGQVNAIVVQADGKILVGGAFANIGGAARSRLARLNADGSVDTTFDPGPDNTVNALALQSDGKLLVGGAFAQISGLPRNRFARLAATGVAAQSVTVDSTLTTVTWARGGGAPELSAVGLEQSADAVTWATLGQATRSGATSSWQLAGLALPAKTPFYLRARGVAPGSEFGSSSVIEVVRYIVPTTAAGIGDALSVSAAVAGDAAPGSSALSITSSATASDAATPPSGATVRVAQSTSGSRTTGESSNATATSGSTVSRLAALSARGVVSDGNPLVTGFVVTGGEPKGVLVRAVGPGLTAFGVQGALAHPQLQVYDAAGQLLLTAGAWEGKDSLAQTFVSVGAFPLAITSADAAAVITLPPGVYTVEVTDLDGTGGVALVEVYDLP